MPTLTPEQTQAQVDALPPVDTSKVSFKVTRFQAWPSAQHTTAWRLTAQAKVLASGDAYPYTRNIPIDAVSGMTQEQIRQWWWEQPETQLYARTLQAKLTGWQPPAPEPVELPPGNVVGQPFEPAQTMSARRPLARRVRNVLPPRQQ